MNPDLLPYPVSITPIDDGMISHVDEGQGEPLLLVHGSLCDMRFWRYQVPELCHHARLIVPSLRYYWPHHNPGSKIFSADQHADDLARLLDHLGIEKAHVLGHSRGGVVSLAFAIRHPDRVKSLILCDPGLRDPNNHSIRHLQSNCWATIKAGDKEGGLRQFVDGVSGEGTWDRTVSWFKQMNRDNASTLEFQSVEPYVYGLNISDFAAFAHPITLISGGQSPEPFPSVIRMLKDSWPHAKLHILEHSTHGMNLMQPHDFNLIVIDHLAQAASKNATQ